MNQSPLELVLLIASLLSAVLVSISIIIHYILPKLRRSPGQFLLMMQFSQLIIDLTLIITILLPSKDQILQEHCQVFSSIFTFNLLFSTITSVCLKCEIFLQIRARVSTSYTKRNKLYYFLIFLFSACLMLLCYKTGSLGRDEFSYCSVKTKSFGEYFIYTFIMIDAICLWVLIFYVKVLVKTSFKGSLKKFVNLIFVTSIIVTCLVVVLFVNLFNRSKVLKIMVSALLLAAVNLATIYRILDPSVVRELKWKFFKEKMRMVKRTDSSYMSTQTTGLLASLRNQGIDMRESLEIKDTTNLIKVLTCLTLRFEAKHPEVENNQGQSIYYFHEEQFFDVMENYGIEGVENCEIYLVYDPNIGIIEYQPEIFEDIRRRAGIDEDKFKNSFFTKGNLKIVGRLKRMKGGKSDSYIFCTDNQLFVVKVVSEHEMKNLLDLIPFYYKRVKNSLSRFVRIYGAFKILPEKVHVIVMQNLIRHRNKYVIFDLKGSTYDRSVSIDSFPTTGTVLKDLNFIENQVKILIDAERENILTSLKRDFEVLQYCQIIDYSLMVAIKFESFQESNKIVFDDSVILGIIDFLQNYNFFKKTEKTFKGFCGKKDFSITNPREYYNRICLFLNEIFEVQ